MKCRKALLGYVIFAIVLSACGGQIKAKHTPPLEDIIAGRGMSDPLEHFEKPQDYRNLSDAIVYGEIADFEMIVSKSGFIHTLETIHVIETLHGDIEPGSDVQLMETGGYALAKDILNVFSDELTRKVYRENFMSYLSDEEIETKYIAEVPDGYYYPEIGRRAVYCLKEKENREGIYRVTAGWMGTFREVEDGIFAKPSTDNSINNPERAAGFDGTITYEELKEQILNAK